MKIISGFPGIGKTIFEKNFKNHYDIMDLDSSNFNKRYFPDNYVKHIKEFYQTKKYDFLLISSHKEVRKQLTFHKIPYINVYPNPSLKNNYIQSFRRRGDNQIFIQKMRENWHEWLSSMVREENKSIQLDKGVFLSHVIKYI